jgi:hypothetical protein
MKVVEENDEKIFTKNIRKDIIKKKYNPLYKDKNYYKGDGLYMIKINEAKDVTLEKLEEGLTENEKNIVMEFSGIFKKVYQKGMIDCFNYYNKDGTF